MREIIRELRERPADAPLSSETVLKMKVGGMEYALFRTPVQNTVHLSPREREIVRLVAEGLPNKSISAVLEISIWTVATHLRRIFAKVGVTSRTAMIARLMDHSGNGSCGEAAEPSETAKWAARSLSARG